MANSRSTCSVNCSFRMGFSRFMWIMVLIAINSCTAQIKEDSILTFDVLYNAGIESYLEEKWNECAEYMVKAIQDYKTFQESLIDCRLKCATNRNTVAKFLSYEDIDARNKLADLAFFESAIIRSDCIRRCKQQKLTGRPDSFNADILAEFDRLQPYDYLQICSYKGNNLNMAASAALTFLLANPDHKEMKLNVQFYRTLNVKDEHFYNMEMKKHQDLYIKGVQTYGSTQYVDTITHIEAALVEYYDELERCSLLCEGPYDHESLPDFYNAIADHWIVVLHCKQKCPIKLATINGALVDNYLVEHYNYLQFSYYQAKELKEAAACVATYLLMRPDDEIMNQNKAFYLTMNQVKKNDFIPRQVANEEEKNEYEGDEALIQSCHMMTASHSALWDISGYCPMDATEYTQAQKMEQVMLEFVGNQYKFSDADEDDGREEQKKPKDVPSDLTDPDKFRNPDYYSEEAREAEAFGKRDEKNFANFQRFAEELGVTIYKHEEEMNGFDRFVLDGVLDEEQCGVMQDLAKFGYGGREIGKLGPKAKFEVYDGLKVPAIRELVENGTIDLSMGDLFFKTTDKMRHIISTYFNLKWPLYIDFVHVACKNPVVDDKGEPRDEYYQTIHADNCIMRKNGQPCLRDLPARFWRDFTTILYLNDLDEGGEFAFADNNFTMTHKVAPKCGRMVVFNSTHGHGVMAYKKEKRCTIGMWTTLDPTYADRDMDQAKASMNVIRNVENNPKLKDFIEEHNIKINMTEAELNGPDRFAADNVITEEECDALIHLAKTGGVAGDGYSNGRLTSVNTENEEFAGLTVAKAAESGGVRGDGYQFSRGSPHTANEMFEGVTVLRSAELAAEGKLETEWVKLYLEKSNLVKELAQRYFKLDKPLYFDYTHLVCRTALHETDKLRTDLSHPIHSDNCIIQSDNSCKKAPPAYTQRDYSSLLYLNGNFSGGNFIFTHQNMTIQSMVKPRCGMAVTFDAGIYHGVQAVTSGQRCALAAWYTLDKRYDEAAHGIAKQILQGLEGKPLGPPVSAHDGGEL